MDLNNVSMTGRLTREVEIKEIRDTLLGTFTLAVGGFKDSVIFINCKKFDRSLDRIRQYLTKGQQVAITGSLEEEKWQAKDGTDKSRFVINVRELVLIGSKNKTEEVQVSVENFNDEEVPF